VKQIFVDIDKCTGCLTCTLACAAEHSSSKDIVGAMLEKVQPRISVEAVNGKAVPLMCRHCEEPTCVDACMTGAMQKDKETGIVSNENNDQSCIGCWMCIMACPYGAIQPNEEEGIAIKCDKCDGREVPACVESCHTGALIYVDGKTFAQEKLTKTAKALTEAS